MKINIKTKKLEKNAYLLKILIFTAFSSSLLYGASTLTTATSSPSFQLDFGGIVTESNNSKSTNFEMQSGITGIETNLSSPSYQISTINLIPKCGNGILELNEVCDTTNFGGNTCATYGFSAGSLSCSSCTSIITTACFTPVVPPSGGGGGGIVWPIPKDEEDEHNVADETTQTSEVDFEDIDIPYEVETKEDEGQSLPEEDTTPPDQVKPPKEEIPQTPVEEKPFIVIKPGTTLKTTDKTPVLIDQIEDKEILSVALSEKNKTISSEELKTLDSGKIVFEQENDLTIGKYGIEIKDETNKRIKKLNIEIVEDKYAPFKIDSFIELKQVSTESAKKSVLDLGNFSQASKPEIIGRTEPLTQIDTYFFTENDIIRLQSVSDETGNFKINLPENLPLGKHKILVLQKYPDEVISDDFEFEFEFVPKYNKSFAKISVPVAEKATPNIGFTVLLLAVILYILLVMKRKK